MSPQPRHPKPYLCTNSYLFMSFPGSKTMSALIGNRNWPTKCWPTLTPNQGIQSCTCVLTLFIYFNSVPGSKTMCALNENRSWPTKCWPTLKSQAKHTKLYLCTNSGGARSKLLVWVQSRRYTISTNMLIAHPQLIAQTRVCTWVFFFFSPPFMYLRPLEF